MLTVGFDSPSVDCIILARPIKSIPLGIQIFGRVLRTDPKNKNKKALILDLCNVYENVGLPKDYRNFNLKKPEKREKRDSSETVAVTVACPHCKVVSPKSECKKTKKVSTKFEIVKIYCPLCGGLIDEERTDLSVVNKLVKIKETVVQKLTAKDRAKILRRLIKEQTRYKEGVVHFVAKAFKENDCWFEFDKIVHKHKNDEGAMWRSIWRKKNQLENDK